MAAGTSGPARSGCGPGTIELNADRADDERIDAGHRQHRRPAGPDRLPPAPAGRQRRARLRPRRRARLPAGHPVRHVPAVRARRVARGAAVALRGDRRVPGIQRDGRGPRWLRSPRSAYAALYGPTVGDQVRLGDTDLWIEVEEDLTVGGEEAVFGGGKSIRESMAQGTHDPSGGRARTPSSPTSWSWTGGASSGPTSASATAGSSRSAGRATPTSPTACTPTCVIGAVDRRDRRRGPDPHRRRDGLHVHLLSPSQLHEALATGITTIVRRRHRPVRGLEGDDGDAGRVAPASRCTARLDACRSTCCCWARATRSAPRRCASRRWPARRATRCTRTGAPPRPPSTPRCGPPTEWGLQVALHSDSLNEAGYVESTLRAIDGRGRSTRSTSRARAAATRRTSCRSPPAARHPRLDEPDAAAHGQHRRRAPRHADGLPPPNPGRPGGPGVRRVADPGDDDRRRGHPARPGRASRSRRRTRRRWAGSAR